MGYFIGYFYGIFLWDILWEICIGYLMPYIVYCIMGISGNVFFGSNHSNVNIWREIVVIKDMATKEIKVNRKHARFKRGKHPELFNNFGGLHLQHCRHLGHTFS